MEKAPATREVSAEEFFTSPSAPGEHRLIVSRELRLNPNAFVAYIYFYVAPGLPLSKLAEVRKVYRSVYRSKDLDIGLARAIGSIKDKYEPLLHLYDPPNGGPMACPLCGVAIDGDPEHWRLSGRAPCAVRAYLTKEEAALELGALGATPESLEAAKIMDQPFVVNAAMAVLRGRRLHW